MNFQRMTDLNLAGKRVLIREDLNVPVKNGVITSDARLRAALPTIKAALEKGAAVMVFSDLGRPVEGEDKLFCLKMFVLIRVKRKIILNLHKNMQLYVMCL